MVLLQFTVHKMATVATGNISRSSTNGSNSGDFSVNDCLCCMELKAELNTLQNEVISLNEIINLLQSEIKTTCHSETITMDTVSCRNCIKPEKQLRLALEDSCSQKLNTECEKKEGGKEKHQIYCNRKKQVMAISLFQPQIVSQYWQRR